MRGIWKYILCVVIVALISSGIWAFVMHQRTKSITEKFEGEISQLTATLDALGPSVECYTVTEEFVHHYGDNVTGQIITEASIMPIEVPSSLVGDAYITDPTQIIGKYCKVHINPGTPITGELLMGEWYHDTLRDVDIVVNAWVVGMRVGDYVDLRITYPYGEDYIVLPHKRIQYIGDRTVKMYLNEDEWHTYQSALVDYYLNQQNGVRLYFTKYVEPGVQAEATAYYAPTEEVLATMRLDPNVVDLAAQNILSQRRAGIDNILNQFITEQTTLQAQGGYLSGGRSQLSSDVNTDFRTRAQEEEGQSNEDEEDTYVEEEVAINFEEDSLPEDSYSQETAAQETETYAPVDETVAPVDETVAVDETSPVDETVAVDETSGGGTQIEITETTAPESQAPIEDADPAFAG